ncbi:hypothetical protein BOX15_Mlig029271g1 [Macrostomum lignano]|uniref:Amiloride-sensitive sodium channel n=1 Tax=Macrostomum lignano TaxID=282301 RepID=A0A267DDZ6_9PLAT|nr:hypothetical protein BOX15_Mlig029271g1 [Macrostomum lignano]
MINQRSAILGACRVDACSRVTQSIPGLVRDQVGNALLASRFGSSIGIGFTGCSFGNQACTMEDFTTLLHPELGLCHRFNQEKFVGLTKDLKATESLLSFNYFTDSTDSKGRRLPGLSRMAKVIFPGLVDANDDTLSAMKVILVPKGQFPWRENAITASPGQHLQLNIRFDKLNRYSKPPTQECRPPAGPTVYRIPSWRTSWNYSSPELDSFNMTTTISSLNWSAKLQTLRGRLRTVNSSISPMSENLTFEMQDQRDCVNLYAVKKFIEHCGCLPSFLPVPVQLFQNYTYCFNQTDMESIKRMEKCYTERMSSISRYEMEARQVCLTMCNTRFYTFRPITYPWPGLTIETAVDFMQNSQGDWSYPYNFLFSKGIANLFYLDIRSSEMYNRSTMLSASELLDFRNKLEVLQESLVKVSIKPVSDFGQEMTEEPSYTIKNLLADLGGALGLWSGISVLTACELIELLVYLVAATRRTEQPTQPSGPATGNAEQQDSGEMKADDSATEVEMTDKMTDIAAPEVSISVP